MASSTCQRLFNRIHDALLGVKEELESDLPAPPLCLAKAQPTQAAILAHPEENECLNTLALHQVSLPSYDPGVLNNELLSLELYATPDSERPGHAKKPKGNITEGTYSGTQIALTQMYQRIENIYVTYFDVLAIEPTLPRYISLEDKKAMFPWSAYPFEDQDQKTPAQYPPHLAAGHIPKDQNFTPFDIFGTTNIVATQIILQKIVPDEDGFLGRTKKWLVEKSRVLAFDDGGDPSAVLTMEDAVRYNKHHRKTGTDISHGGNIGLLDDWYSDRRFADQSLTGTNPTTLTVASARWIGEFVQAAQAAQEEEWEKALAAADASSLFVQDASYVRAAIGVEDPGAILHHKQESSNDNWAVGSVTLFQLHDDGSLHPVAITIDYKGSMDRSVTLFNKRHGPQDSTSGEKQDWPWRYAKTCAQVSDWMRHELGVHLTQAHLIEEATIVAANRTLPMEHPVYRLLSPHWYKTLSLNAAARQTLVPQVVTDIVGLSPDQCYAFIKHHFAHFDWVGNYVPNDLAARGFPHTAEGLGSARYRNYPYARNMLALWKTLRAYVQSMLLVYYDAATADADVAKDAYVQAWAAECRGPGHIATFPSGFATLDALVEAVTMCIHVASPYHSAVNYLQNFYQAFVVAKPPCLCRAPPATLDELRAFTERDLVASLPLHRQREWLLAAQLPWLLSHQVDADRSLLNFAASQWHVYKYKKGGTEVQIRDISAILYRQLQGLQKEFFHNSRDMAEGSIPYMVMDPGLTAVSILR